MSFVVITEWLLYLSFSLIMGTAILYNVPFKYRVHVALSKKLMLIGTIGSIIFSYGLVLAAILIFGSDIGYWHSFTSVMLTFELGKTWYMILTSGLLLFGLVYFNNIDQDPFLAKLAIVLVTVMIIAYAKASHAASLEPVYGFIAHFIHLWFISIWGGILLVVSWNTKQTESWLAFIKWYTPLAVICIITILISGFFTMAIDFKSPVEPLLSGVPGQYQNGLSVNYGQALLLKHLFILPLILFAALNAFYTRYQLKNGIHRHAIPLARTESFFLVIVYMITAYMGQQAPPHDVIALIKQEGFSPTFLFFYPSAAASIIPLHFGWSGLELLFLATSMVLMILIIFAVVKNLSKTGAAVLSIAFVFSTYTGIVLGLH